MPNIPMLWVIDESPKGKSQLTIILAYLGQKVIQN